MPSTVESTVFLGALADQSVGVAAVYYDDGSTQFVQAAFDPTTSDWTPLLDVAADSELVEDVLVANDLLVAMDPPGQSDTPPLGPTEPYTQQPPPPPVAPPLLPPVVPIPQDVQDKVNKLRKEIEDLEAEKDVISKQIDVLDKKADEAQALVEHYQNERRRLVGERDDAMLRGDNETALKKQGAIDYVREQENKAQKEANRLNDEIREKRTQIGDKNKQIQDKQAEIGRLLLPYIPRTASVDSVAPIPAVV